MDTFDPNEQMQRDIEDNELQQRLMLDEQIRLNNQIHNFDSKPTGKSGPKVLIALAVPVVVFIVLYLLIFGCSTASAQETLSFDPLTGKPASGPVTPGDSRKSDETAFSDLHVRARALKSCDLDHDGTLTRAECDSLRFLDLTPYRSDMFKVSTYDDLKLFPNLEDVFLGESDLDCVDLSANFNLKTVGIYSRNLRTIVIAAGCSPRISFPACSGEVLVRRVVNPDAPGALFMY